MEKCSNCNAETYAYPEGYFCPNCQREEILKIAKKYYVSNFQKKGANDDEQTKKGVFE